MRIFFLIIGIIAGIVGIAIVLGKIDKIRFIQRIADGFGKKPDMDSVFESIKEYYESIMDDIPKIERIDEITWQDIDMDMVFDRINCSYSSAGEEALYARLHRKHTKKQLLEFERLMEDIGDEKNLLDLSVHLAMVGKSNFNGLVRGIKQGVFERLGLAFACKIYPFLIIASLLIIPFNIRFGVGLTIFFVVSEMVLYFYNKTKIEFNLFSLLYADRVLYCAKKICKSEYKNPIFKELKECFAPFSSICGRFSGMINKANSEMNFIVDYLKIFTLHDINFYNRAVGKLEEHRDKFLRLYEIIGTIDNAACVLSVRRNLECCLPTITDEIKIEAEKIYHLLIDNPISNSVTILGDTMITGSNASGKSSFIKALAVNCVLAQSINTCTAKSLTIPSALVISSMAVSDSISNGDSYFVAEIKSLKRIVEMSDKCVCLCFIDEILKGTNTIERIAASAGVLSGLHKKQGIVITATHDMELTEIMTGFENYFFTECFNDDGLYFDYRIRSGAADTGNALILMEQLGFDSEICERAGKMAQCFRECRSWDKI